MSLRSMINLILAPLPAPVEPVVESAGPETLRSHLVKRGTGPTFLNWLDVIGDRRRGELVFPGPLAEPLNCRQQPLKIFARSRATLDTAASLLSNSCSAS